MRHIFRTLATLCVLITFPAHADLLPESLKQKIRNYAAEYQDFHAKRVQAIHQIQNPKDRKKAEADFKHALVIDLFSELHRYSLKKDGKRARGPIRPTYLELVPNELDQLPELRRIFSEILPEYPKNSHEAATLHEKLSFQGRQALDEISTILNELLTSKADFNPCSTFDATGSFANMWRTNAEVLEKLQKQMNQAKPLASENNPDLPVSLTDINPDFTAPLYRISVPGTAKDSPGEILLLGTQHNIPLSAFPTPVKKRLESIDLLVWELSDNSLDEIPYSLDQLQKLGIYRPDGFHWTEKLSPENLALLKSLEPGLEKAWKVGELDRYHPALIEYIFGEFFLRGKSYSNGIDNELVARQRDHKRPLLGLETEADRAKAAKRDQQLSQAAILYDLTHVDQRFTKMRKQSAAPAPSVSAKEFVQYAYIDFEHDFTLDRELNQRNMNWIPKMESIIRENQTGPKKEAFPKVVFAVGAGHLGGPTGIIHLLRSKGFTVERIDTRLKKTVSVSHQSLDPAAEVVKIYSPKQFTNWSLQKILKQLLRQSDGSTAAVNTTLVSLDLSACRVTPKDLEYIQQHFPRLTVLNLTLSGVGDSDLATIAQMKDLRHLKLSLNDRITDKNLDSLGQLPHVEWIDLKWTSATPEGIADTLKRIKAGETFQVQDDQVVVRLNTEKFSIHTPPPIEEGNKTVPDIEWPILPQTKPVPFPTD